MRVTFVLPLMALAACATADDTGDSAGTDTADTGGDTGADTADTETGADTAETGETGDTADTGEPVDTADSGDTADTAVSPPPAVLLFIGDGMGFPHVQGGGQYANGAAGTLFMESLPVQGQVRTASLSGTTDSAASATALATGTKTLNDVVGQDESGTELQNLLERARARGLSVGVVTTDTLTGATPSAFVAHTSNRSNDDEIVADYAASLPDVALGGGQADFTDVLGTLAANVVLTRTELLAAVSDGRPLFGAFASSSFPYLADGYTSETPSLTEMTQTALSWLSADPDGFVLLVEGARIDHASHARASERVFHEVVAFDEAIAAADTWAATAPNEVTLVVTADHECGGLTVDAGSPAGTIPTASWRWGQHTNADVPVFGRGTLAATLDGQRLDQLWIHAVLAAAVDGATVVTPPTVPSLVDGTTAELGAAVATQTWATSFGAGYNQLDALRVSADTTGLRVGVDGVFERGDNAVLVLVDLDYGGGTGLGADLVALDLTFGLDAAITGADLTLDAIPGLGFDAVLGAVGAEEVMLEETLEDGGLRGLDGDIGTAGDFFWLAGVSAFDDGNVAEGAAAADAGATGLTENGMEGLLPWSSLFPAGLSSGGADLAVAVVLVNYTGEWASNQALPPLGAVDEPGEGTMTLVQAVRVTVDATGALTSAPALVP